MHLRETKVAASRWACPNAGTRSMHHLRYENSAMLLGVLCGYGRYSTNMSNKEELLPRAASDPKRDIIHITSLISWSKMNCDNSSELIVWFPMFQSDFRKIYSKVKGFIQESCIFGHFLTAPSSHFDLHGKNNYRRHISFKLVFLYTQLEVLNELS